MIFGVGISGKYISYEGHLVVRKCLKFHIGFKNGKKIQKKFFVFEIIGSELVALNCLYSADNASHGQSIC